MKPDQITIRAHKIADRYGLTYERGGKNWRLIRDWFVYGYRKGYASAQRSPAPARRVRESK